ncbi:MAG TPA: MBL fold metallo-hydrolase [Candidatus Sulfotelmatobacter sp.]|nr:MBL fold metallo-hydrolase [Candidatus Sulfotelmatobacter sp.]
MFPASLRVISGNVTFCVLTVGLSLTLFSSPQARAAKAAAQADPACEKAGPKGCATLALEAMGGASRLDAIKSVSYESLGSTELVEQSYRQAPFISSYERAKGTLDLANNRLRVETLLTWPEADPGQSEARITMVASLEGCVKKSPAPASDKPAPDNPCSSADVGWVRDTLSLGPLRLLPTALEATDLHFEAPEMLRSTPHTVLAFNWQGTPVKILLNPFNHLPDAVETVGVFQDHWYQWGDVQRRIYLDNYQTFHGVRYPTNQIEERNGLLWKSTQYLDLKFDVPADSSLFDMDAKVSGRGAKSTGWGGWSFDPKGATDLAPGITFFPGAWNSTVVKQDDGIVVLEAPISGTYTGGVIAEAGNRYPNLPLKAALSTSDSWPHVGGVRQAVASQLPVYILDLNQPLLDRLVSAKHTLQPDPLEKVPQKAVWKIVAQKTILGSGDNRMELYPLRGPCTERQYMVYFPQHQLLYASDTLALNDDGSLYDPELMREVIEAVQREGLQVKTVFAMHQAPVSWESVLGLVRKAMS